MEALGKALEAGLMMFSLVCLFVGGYQFGKEQALKAPKVTVITQPPVLEPGAAGGNSGNKYGILVNEKGEEIALLPERPIIIIEGLKRKKH